MQSFTITLADTNVHNLKDLIQAADALKANPVGADLICEYRTLQLLADKANTDVIGIGGSDLTDLIFSEQLAAGELRYYDIQPLGSPVFAKEIYVKAKAANQILHIEGTL